MNAFNVAAFLVGLLGLASVVAGVALLSLPAAFITFGIVAMLWSAFVARAVARARNRKG